MSRRIPKAAHRASTAWASTGGIEAPRHAARPVTAGFRALEAEAPDGTPVWWNAYPWGPRPADVVDLRAHLLGEWSPGGSLAALAPVLEMYRAGATGPLEWERQTLGEAALWYVGGDMCDLLVGAAPGLPSIELVPELMPDVSGLVVFGRALGGLDADGSEAPVMVGAMLWGPCWWPGKVAGLDGIEHRPLRAWGPRDEDGPVPALGVTVYRPTGRWPQMMPIGSLVWPLGYEADAPLSGDPAKDASMAEDRRRLAALWLLSAQPGVASTRDAPLPRQVVRRAERAGQLPRVRVVQLRQATGDHRGATAEGGRTYHHRWAVAGHWRQQAWGPGHSQRRPTYINPYLKGPEGAPLVDRPVVKAWTR